MWAQNTHGSVIPPAVEETPCAEETQDVEMTESQTEQHDTRRRLNYWARKRLRDFYARQLCTPEWMVEVPLGLNGNGSASGQGWYVLARPEGKRCLVVSAKGNTVARLQDGEILHKFRSQLPNGSASSGYSNDYSILDCVFHEEDQTFYVLDMMCWKVRWFDVLERME
jgi:snurportin-1